MSTHKLKELAAPRIAKAKEEQNDKLDVMIELLIVGNESKEAGNESLEELCESKKIQQESDDNFRNEWFKASNKKFYVSLLAIMITGTVLWLDVLRINPDSEIVGSVIGVTKVVAGFFL